MIRTVVSYGGVFGYFAIMAGAMLLGGCGGSSVQEGFHPTEEHKAILPIADFNDFKGRPKEFSSVFAPGAAPVAEQARYARYSYNTKAPKLSGDTATVPVTVKEPRSGNVIGEVEWNMVKVNDEWKIKDAPLPPEAK